VINYIALAVPVFFAGIAVELAVARRRGLALYRFGDAIADMSSGLLQQVAELFAKLALLGAYAWIWRHHRLVSLDGAAAWIVAIVGVDFAYYWWHRLSHEVNFLWAAHVAHHTSEDYNLAVALRQSVFTSWTGWAFYAPLALLGVPPLVYATAHAFNTLYQFWLHTQLIGRMENFERVFNSPSLHRVHHAINPRYLDKNYGGTFMIWDRLFGTFEPETEPCVYGIVKPLGSFDAVWTQIHYYVELLRHGGWWRSPAFGKPPAPAVSPSTYVKWEPPGGTRLRPVVLTVFAPLIAGSFFYLLWDARIPMLPRAAIALGIFAVTIGIGRALQAAPSDPRARIGSAHETS
jgi:sterol desaturase/sphingolipid hydroxylase (fatty acid hydroxylase superfamily)